MITFEGVDYHFGASYFRSNFSECRLPLGDGLSFVVESFLSDELSYGAGIPVGILLQPNEILPDRQWQ